MRKGMKTIMIAAVAAVLLLSAAFVIHEKVAVIQHVLLAGVSDENLLKVYNLSGLKTGMSYFDVDENTIRKGINSDYHYVYQSLEKIWPDTVVLYVQEQTPALNIQEGGGGRRFVTSSSGVVLSVSNVLDEDNGCIYVNGLNIRDIREHSRVVCMEEGQFDSVTAVVEELRAQGWVTEIASMDASRTESLTLTTRDGYTIRIGNVQSLRGKLGTVRAVLMELRARGLQGGTIEATVPGEASYLPQ